MSGLNWTKIPHTDDDNDDASSQSADEAFTDSVQYQAPRDDPKPRLERSNDTGHPGDSIFTANNAAHNPSIAAPAVEQESRDLHVTSPTQTEQQTDDDLFNRRPTLPLYNPADEPEEIFTINKTSVNSAHRAAYLAALGKTPKPPQPAEHINSCPGTAGASTPPPTPPATTAPNLPTNSIAYQQPPWLGPDDTKDLPTALKKHKRFHDRAFSLRPPLQLAPHRYWIAILNPGLKPHLATKESHFLWMKGNRFTTVETVWQTFSAMNAEAEFVLMCGGERFEGKAEGDMVKEVRMEELDFWGDKVVVFRVVGEREEGSEGKLVSEGLVPTRKRVVIELD